MNTSNISTDDRNESRPIKRIDHRRHEKTEQRVRKGMLRDATRNWEVPKPKLGLTPINKRNFKIWRLVFHVAAEECYCVWTDCGWVGVEQERHRVEREEGDFERRFLTNNYYATTRTKPTTSHKPPCSTQPLFFTQPVKLNNTGQSTSHKPMLQQLHRMPRCTNSISTTTNNHIPWDSDTLAYIDSFHPSQ